MIQKLRFHISVAPSFSTGSKNTHKTNCENKLDVVLVSISTDVGGFCLFREELSRQRVEHFKCDLKSHSLSILGKTVSESTILERRTCQLHIWDFHNPMLPKYKIKYCGSPTVTNLPSTLLGGVWMMHSLGTEDLRLATKCSRTFFF